MYTRAAIKKELKANKVKLIDIAGDLGVTHVSVSLVIAGRSTSRRISQAVADAIGRPLAEVFPRYADKKSRTSGPNTVADVGTDVTVPEDRPLLQADR